MLNIVTIKKVKKKKNKKKKSNIHKIEQEEMHYLSSSSFRSRSPTPSFVENNDDNVNANKQYNKSKLSCDIRKGCTATNNMINSLIYYSTLNIFEDDKSKEKLIKYCMT
eukprot:209633_1